MGITCTLLSFHSLYPRPSHHATISCLSSCSISQSDILTSTLASLEPIIHKAARVIFWNRKSDDITSLTKPWQGRLPVAPTIHDCENSALPWRFGYPQVPKNDEILYLLLLLSCLLASTMLTAHDPQKFLLSIYLSSYFTTSLISY